MVASIIYSGITNNFFELAFDNADVTSLTPTQITVLELDTGYRSKMMGINFAAGANGGDPTGTLTGLEISDAANNPVIGISGINWNLTQLIAAIDDEINGNGDLLAVLLGQQPINFNASGSNIGADFSFDGISQPVTILGSAHRDTLSGGALDDIINPGNTDEFDGNVVFGTRGYDAINLGGMGPNRWFDLSYEYEVVPGPVTVNVNGNAGTMSVNKGSVGADTVLNVGNVLGWGLGVLGSASGDTFNLNSGPGGFMTATGMAGNDTFNLTLDGTIRLGYAGGWENNPFTGVTANLATGTVSNDGFGGTDTINILGGTGTFEFMASDFNDNIIGSARDERFILEQGNDVLDAGGGYDTLRYDRNGVEAITANLATGQITGTWAGNAFSHQISNVEEIRGSNNGNDNITGDAGDNQLHGYGGNDSLFGGTGTDRLFGGDGNDVLDPGDNTNFDHLDPGAGVDVIEAGGMVTGFLDVGHFDLRNSTAQVITLDMTVPNGTGGVNATINKGASGTTTIHNANAPMEVNGLGLSGSDLGDTFNATFNAYGWLGFKGGRGNDTYNLSSSGDGDSAIVRLDFQRSVGNEDATQGLNINLASGIVANDGFGGRDQIKGTYALRMEVRGTDRADVIIGSHRDERFIGRAGNDTIDGKDGWDVLRFDRSDIDTGVKVDLAAGTASGVFSGTAFQYTLASIEELRGSDFADVFAGSTAAEVFNANAGNDTVFGDGAAATYYGSAIANQVYRLYQATLDRLPDAGGHAAWAGRIASGERTLLEVTEGFVGSPEFQQTYGNADDSQFVTLLYNNVLDSDPDAKGLARWTGELANGASRAQVVLGFAESPQFTTETTAAANSYAARSLATSWSDEVFRLYQATLDRAPDGMGQTNWAGRLASGERTLLEVAEGFVGSPEFQQTYGNADDTQFVTLLYNNVLDSDPDANGLARWTGDLTNGASRAEVVLGFSQSPQFTAETIADLKAWMRDQGEHDRIEAGGGTNVVAGGQFADTFVFDAGADGATTLRDLEVWDFIDLNGFGYTTQAQARAEMSQAGSHLVFNDQGVQITFENTTLAQITDDMILI